MKKQFAFVGLALLMVLIVVTAVSCNNNPEREKVLYTVTFDPDNNDKTVEVQVEKGSIIPAGSIPENPEKINTKGFKEWRLGDVAYDFDKPVTSNITLKANYWTEKEYNNAQFEATYMVELLTGFCDLSKLYEKDSEQKNLTKFSDIFDTSDDTTENILTCMALLPQSNFDENGLYVLHGEKKYYLQSENFTFDIVAEADSLSKNTSLSTTEAEGSITSMKYTIDFTGLKYKVTPKYEDSSVTPTESWTESAISTTVDLKANISLTVNTETETVTGTAKGIFTCNGTEYSEVTLDVKLQLVTYKGLTFSLSL